MNRSAWRIVFAWAAIALPLGAQTPHQDHVVRGNTIVSTANPSATIEIDKNIRYIGKIDFSLKGIARVERFIFVDADRHRHVRRMFVAQFEGFLPSNAEIYRYKVRTPVKLGDADYQHNVLFYDDAKDVTEEPEAEAAKTRAFVASKGYHLDEQLMMSRFARVVDEEKRHELILFYLENLSDSGQKLATLAANDQDNPVAKAIAQPLLQRSLKAFQVRSEGLSR